MNKRILVSLAVIGAVAASAIGGTMAYFSDTEKSTGNTFTAGALDLKVDHTRQTYNDVDCNTCSVLVISDPTNMVIEKNGVPVPPYAAVYVGSSHPAGFSAPNWFHTAWTAQNDPELLASNAKWIWESDPTEQNDTQLTTTYTFSKTFEWFGPITGSDINMAVGHDNTVEVWLNNVNIGHGTDPQGYNESHMLHIPGSDITNNVRQGTNVLLFKVTNTGVPGSDPFSNPAGLIYKFEIDGNCNGDYFKTHCKLWSEKDLVPGDTFYNFDDIKPGDHGTNVISLHVHDNDAWACVKAADIVDLDNTVVEREIENGDNASSTVGELSQYIKVFAWSDDNNNGIFDPGEAQLLSPNTPLASELIGKIALPASHTQYVGINWCFGTQSLKNDLIDCDGTKNANPSIDITQTDSTTADIDAFATQQRNNPNFSCSNAF